MSIEEELERCVLPHALAMMQGALAMLTKPLGDQAKDEAKDVVQMVQIAAWKSWASIRCRFEEKALRQWLLTSVRRECLHRLITRQNHGDVNIDSIDPMALRFEDYPGSAPHVQQLELREVIQQLPAPFGEIIFAIDYQGITFAEMANVFNVSVDRMYKLHALALSRLKRAIVVTKPTQPSKQANRTKGVDHE